jgi:SAM-dependent methyltransferase
VTEASFAEIERVGWDRRAADYGDVMLPATGQAIAPMLESLGDVRGMRLLDIASGTGHFAAQAARRGADVTGIDLAANMVALARERVPAARFHEGDAEALPFEDELFDAVACGFGLLHLERPGRGVAEAARVLKPGGRLAVTGWKAPGRGNAFLGLITDAYAAHADLDVDLPPASPLTLLTDAQARDPMLRAAGFTEIRARDLDIVWPVAGPETVVEFLEKGSVRSSMIYERQTPEVRRRIRDFLRVGTDRYLRAGEAGIPCPAVLVTAVKAAP